MTLTSQKDKVEWLSEDEIRVNNKVYYISNSQWIKNIIKTLEHENDNDSPKDQEATQST